MVQVQKRFKIVLLGDGGVGKSTWLNRLVSGGFNNKYIPTLGVDVTPVTLYTNYGSIIFDIWDTAGQEKFGGLRDGYYIQADAAIVFFDVTQRVTHRNTGTWKRDFSRVCPDAPIVMCGNKRDLFKERKVGGNNEYIDLSVKSNYNFDQPLIVLARILTGLEDLDRGSSQ
jgi:GTP-binding nuclear protein Ran